MYSFLNVSVPFQGMWRGVLQHVCNIHSWDAGAWCCDHEDLGGEREDGRAWLDPQEDRALVKQLASVVLDQTLIQKAELVITNRLEDYYYSLLREKSGNCLQCA